MKNNFQWHMAKQFTALGVSNSVISWVEPVRFVEYFTNEDYSIFKTSLFISLK